MNFDKEKILNWFKNQDKDSLVEQIYEKVMLYEDWPYINDVFYDCPLYDYIDAFEKTIQKENFNSLGECIYYIECEKLPSIAETHINTKENQLAEKTTEKIKFLIDKDPWYFEYIKEKTSIYDVLKAAEKTLINYFLYHSNNTFENILENELELEEDNEMTL
ncbi:hypothetical protein [Mycoplasmopsis glycophila]|uniref:Uncharacterized protein n=1 Tax=Mycoplasmopsis glycophila TaxID=171285 RepID=A0A449AV32_9BACT|nr:hypothetical protein [Mycoplasmopsis glycophila]VEU70332.1 Uncharacterised protein [Mycoplasmopsis glycophila]